VGGFLGGVVWIVWSWVLNMMFLGPRYMDIQNSGLFLKQAINFSWGNGSCCCSCWQSSCLIFMHGHEQPSGQVRLPPSSLGFVVGFAIGFPGNFAQATWSPIPPVFPLGWMLEMWVGAILATLVAGFLYKE